MSRLPLAEDQGVQFCIICGCNYNSRLLHQNRYCGCSDYRSPKWAWLHCGGVFEKKIDDGSGYPIFEGYMGTAKEFGR